MRGGTRAQALSWGALALLLALALGGCGHSSRRPASTAAKTPPGPPQPSRPAFGITEDNADLLWNPAATAPPQAAAFLPARRELTALHPRYIRLLIDWAALQPSAQNPPDLRAPVSGCARQVGPCGNYEGVAGELAAIASQQRAARAEGRQGFDVVIDILGAPAWAALPPHGCELAATPASARPIGGAALAGYRALIAGLLALAAREGVQLPWWSPWNEPNDPRFLAPQRAACGPDAEPLAPAVYSQLAEAMAAAGTARDRAGSGQSAREGPRRPRRVRLGGADLGDGVGRRSAFTGPRARGRRRRRTGRLRSAGRADRKMEQ